MLKRSLLAAGLIAANISTVHALPYGFYDARSVGMGNVSVATGGITTAALSNPGMLSVNESKDKFALLIPAIGVQAIDDGDMLDLVDEYQALDDSDPATIPQRIDILNKLDGASVIVSVVPTIAFAYSGEDFTWGVTARANAVVTGYLSDIDTSFVNPDATVNALGVLTKEVGIPLGKDFSVAGMQLSVGVIPRMVQVSTIEYSESIKNADIDDVSDRSEEDLGSFTTLDAGVTLNVIDTFRVGLVAKNLLEETKTTYLGREINFDTQLRAGAAFDAGFMTIAADLDLTENEPIAGENSSKSFSLGAEFDTFGFLQVRAGYQTNLASGSTDPDLLSLGLGFWLGFHLDVALVAGDDSSFGAFAQTGFRF